MEKFTIEVEMQDRWIPHFLGMLKYMHTLGNIGSSRTVKFYSDGDGDFRPKFKWDIDVKPVEVVERNNEGTIVGGIKDGVMFDAG